MATTLASTAGMHVPLFVLQLSSRTLNRLGIDSDTWAGFILAATGVDPGAESAQDELIEFPKYLEVLRRACALIGHGRLLRWYIEDARLMQLGVVGTAALTAPTIGHSLEIWLRYSQVLAPVLTFSRRDTQREVILRWDLVTGLDGLDAFYTELALLNVKQHLEYLARRPGALTTRFMSAPVAGQNFYRERFGQSVSFGHDETCIVLPRDLLDTCNESHVPLAWKQAQASCETLAARLRTASRVGPRVREVLVQGSARGFATSLEDVAARLGVSTRTLARRLGEEGASFRDIQCQARIEHAMRQLRHTALPIKAIGANAGFSNFSAFSRAFRKLTELSPSQYRATV